MPFTADFTRDSQYDNRSGVQSVKFGSGAPITEMALNEMQYIQNEKSRTFLKALIGDALFNDGVISFASGNLTITNKYAIVDGYIIYIDSLVKTFATNCNIYLNVSEVEIDENDYMYGYGRIGGMIITNYIHDSRYSNEVTRRKQLQYSFGTSTSGSSLLIGTVSSGVLTLSCDIVKNLPDMLYDIKNPTQLDASKLVGIINIDNLPKGAIERLVPVANDTARFALTSTNVQNGDTVKVVSTGKMYYIIDDTKLSTESGYEPYTAGSASSVPWSGITDKPTEFNPTSHASSTNQFGASSATNYGHSKASSTTPKVASGSGAIGTDNGEYARGDHVHPPQSSADKLTTARKINGVNFDGQTDITVESELRQCACLRNGHATYLYAKIADCSFPYTVTANCEVHITLLIKGNHVSNRSQFCILDISINGGVENIVINSKVINASKTFDVNNIFIEYKNGVNSTSTNGIVNVWLKCDTSAYAMWKYSLLMARNASTNSFNFGTYSLVSTSVATLPTSGYTSVSTTLECMANVDQDGNNIKSTYARKTIVYTATIGTTWVGTTAPYTQDVTVTGLLATDIYPDVDIITSTTLATALLEETAWNCISKIVATDNKITVTCNKKKPVTAMNIIIKVVR